MRINIKNIVKYGVPVIVLLVLLYAIFFENNAGSDPEFGGIGQRDTTILLLIAIDILYLFIGVIFWIITKRNFIFISALLSAIVITMTLLITLV